MVKSIKFNLIIDNKPVRSLDDLLENFNIEDILVAKRNGSLRRWLETRDLLNEIAELEKLSGDEDDNKTALELCRIFNKNCTKEQLEAAVYPFKYRQKEAEKLRQYKNLKEEKDEIIRSYHGDYEKIIKELENNSNNYSFVKPCIAEIFKNYLGLYQLDAEAFYKRFIKDKKLVILAMMANPNIRPILVERQPENKIYEDMEIEAIKMSIPHYTKNDIDIVFEKYKHNKQVLALKTLNSEDYFLDKKQADNFYLLILDLNNNHDLIGTICEFHGLDDLVNKYDYPITYVPVTNILKPMQNYVKTFAGQTDGYWKDVQPKGKQFLVIKMEKGNFVRNAGKNGEEINADDVNGNFLIFNGIDYKSNNDNHQLIYMEV